MKITEALLAEHLVFHNLFDHIEKIAPRLKTLAEVKVLASLMETMLSAHSHTEDELFMKPLEPSFEQLGHCAIFHHEHDLIEQNLALVHESKSLKHARHLLLTTVVLCRSHFDKEERIVFPMAERVLKSKTLLELGQSWMNQRNCALLA
ncbi:MAG TPA: hemerythrin domain-containing protein [Verrucomicrobiae bacterium]|nr:hemerythrin domain-containing protein [Verrucomicrobiae bacterium]